jgi:hypothetical protein
VDTAKEEGQLVPGRPGYSWLRVGARLPSPVKGYDELGELFSHGRRSVLLEPEMLAVEALRLNSRRNRDYYPIEERLDNATLFLGNVTLGNRIITVAGVHADGQKNVGLLKVIHQNAQATFDELRTIKR